MVHNCEKVFISIGRRHGHEIDVNVVEAPGWHFEVADWRHHIMCDLSALARQAMSCPFCYFCFKVGPHKFWPDCLHGTVDARMSEAEDIVEGTTTPHSGNPHTGWPLDTSTYRLCPLMSIFLKLRPDLASFATRRKFASRGWSLAISDKLIPTCPMATIMALFC